jgi:hypothetical protein
MKLIDVPKAFATDEMCLAYLEAKRWPHGVRCTLCGAKEVTNRKFGENLTVSFLSRQHHIMLSN